MSEADAQVAASMVKRLGGMRMCEEGMEGSMTHLVLSSPRRTLKVQYGLLMVQPAYGGQCALR